VTIVRVLIRSLALLLSNRLRFPRSDIGRVLTMEDGEQFTVFRHAKVKAPGTPAAIFIVRFAPALRLESLSDPPFDGLLAISPVKGGTVSASLTSSSRRRQSRASTKR
jgi:hypothetical protein